MSSDLFRKKALRESPRRSSSTTMSRSRRPGSGRARRSVRVRRAQRSEQAVLILRAGAFVWGILGRLETTVPAVVISRDGAAVCCYDTAYGAEVGAGMPVRVVGEELSLVSVSSEAVQLGADAPEAGFDAGQYVYVSELSGSVGDGVYEAEIVVDSIAPLSFLWN